ncbi:hypothetical protein [uncultured Planococcus sp.]|uniref:hypothetical protein n=1 Tax=uncultured Planococcus sp. TaxID=337815 RepID=UPI00260BF59D|nr:hypothetical protein [uncultured Planococcus sp.]
MEKPFEIPIGIKDQLEDNMEVITTIFSPALSGIGILIIGENYHEDADHVVVRIYLLGNEETEWFIQDELQAFAFLSLASAQRFIINLPSMSALDLMLVMSGHGSKSHQPVFFQ